MRLQLSGLVYPDPLVLAEGQIVLATRQGGAPSGEKDLKENIIDHFISWFHTVFKRVNCTHKIWKFRSRLWRRRRRHGYDSLRSPPATRCFPSNPGLFHYIIGLSPVTVPRCRWPSVVIIVTSSPNTNSASSARSCVFTTRALLLANFWNHWLGSQISFPLD